LAVAVSGGADSTALALLTQRWTAEHGGQILALIIDHGLRPASAAEAALTRHRLTQRAIPAEIITLDGLGQQNLQETARKARHAALATAARRFGALFLLFGHHAADQSETVTIRAARGTGGLEGIAGWSARADVILLRPLLGISPEILREFLHEEEMLWVEDPSNHDPRFERVRVRHAGTGAIAKDAAERRAGETATALFLARYTFLRPEGFAIIRADAMPEAALGALMRVVGGGQYQPRQRALAALGARVRPATLGGVRLAHAGRLGPGWLVVREPAACAPAIPAVAGAIWDGRFRLEEEASDHECGALGKDLASFRDESDLPASVLAGLPCIRQGGTAKGKPRLAKALFLPPVPAASLPFQAEA
jgi:tRNA(Ile)-lysidine synthase